MKEPLILPATRAVFFDAVGTVIQPHPIAPEVYRAAAAHFGLTLDAAEAARRFQAAFRREEEADGANDWAVNEQREWTRWSNIVADVLRELSDVSVALPKLWEHFAQPTAWRVLDGVAETLQALADRGLTLGLASNFDGRLHAILDELPELEPLEHCVISSEVGWRKPAPRFFAAVIDAARCDPGEIIFVGDRRDSDYEGALAAGMRAVWLDTGHEEHPGVRRIRRLTELIA